MLSFELLTIATLDEIIIHHIAKKSTDHINDLWIFSFNYT